MEAVRHTIEYTRDPASLSANAIAEMNVEILRRSLGPGQSFSTHAVNFSVHRSTGFIRQIPNVHGWIFTDSDDVKCSVVTASDTGRPIVVCDERVVSVRATDVICAMDVYINQ